RPRLRLLQLHAVPRRRARGARVPPLDAPPRRNPAVRAPAAVRRLRGPGRVRPRLARPERLAQRRRARVRRPGAALLRRPRRRTRPRALRTLPYGPALARAAAARSSGRDRTTL